MPFKVIIAGSRNFNDYDLLRQKCDKILSGIKEEIWIISGCATGADRLGEDYAHEKGYYVMECPAPWSDIEDKPDNEIGINSKGYKYWKLAGPYRNELMAKEADALIAFNAGTKGTKSMITIATKYKLKIREIKV